MLVFESSFISKQGRGIASGDRRRFAVRVTVFSLVLLVVVSIASLTVGASGTSLIEALITWGRGDKIGLRESVILFDIRAPRTLMGIMVGASLAVSGAVMQGLFRNPWPTLAW